MSLMAGRAHFPRGAGHTRDVKASTLTVIVEDDSGSTSTEVTLTAA